MSLVDILSVGVDRMQRNFEPMRKQVETWKGTRLPDETAKLVIYRAFVEGELEAITPGRRYGKNGGGAVPRGGRQRYRVGADARTIRQYCHIVSGVFTPVLAKHTKHLSLVDVLSIEVDRIQRNFEPMW